MMDDEVLVMLVVITLTIFVFVVVFLLLLVASNSKRNKHRAELAEIEAKKNQAVIEAEREATKTTFGEIGRELHDNVGQLLTAAQIGFQTRFDEQIDTDEQLSAINDALGQGVQEVSRLGRSLNENMWRNRNVFEAIEAEATRIKNLGFMHVVVSTNGTAPELSPTENTILFRTFQEVISNALKHSQASELNIQLVGEPLTITIKDNGNGFDEQDINHGSGLYNIQHRCELIQFEAQLEAKVGQGCTWIFIKKELQ